MEERQKKDWPQVDHWYGWAVETWVFILLSSLILSVFPILHNKDKMQCKHYKIMYIYTYTYVYILSSNHQSGKLSNVYYIIFSIATFSLFYLKQVVEERTELLVQWELMNLHLLCRKTTLVSNS